MSEERRIRLVVGLVLCVLASGSCGGGGSDAGPREPRTASVPATGDVGGLDPSSPLDGDASPSFPGGDQGVVAVVGTGPLSPAGPGPATVAVAVRNNTSTTATNLTVTVIAQDAQGERSVGSSGEVTPSDIAPGQVALALVVFPDDARPEPAMPLQATVASAGGDSTRTTLDVSGATSSAGTVTGEATNAETTTVHGPYPVYVYCFDEAGALGVATSGSARARGPTPAGRSVMFEVDLDDHLCPRFAVAVTAAL
jgi:hypothetical protein